ncbi:MAG: NnrS family protein [Halieaceae bacterium]|nr:NnrS family protein [Halieaceae bacterium]
MRSRAETVKVQAQALFFPAAALYAALAPWLLLASLTGTAGLVFSGAAHARGLLFGYVGALIAGYLLGKPGLPMLSLLFGLWLAGRLAELVYPASLLTGVLYALYGLLLAGLVTPKFRAAKKWRNRVAGPLIALITCFPLLDQALLHQGGARDSPIRGIILPLALLMFFMGGRIITPALAVGTAPAPAGAARHRGPGDSAAAVRQCRLYPAPGQLLGRRPRGGGGPAGAAQAVSLATVLAGTATRRSLRAGDRLLLVGTGPGAVRLPSGRLPLGAGQPACHYHRGPGNPVQYRNAPAELQACICAGDCLPGDRPVAGPGGAGALWRRSGPGLPPAAAGRVCRFLELELYCSRLVYGWALERRTVKAAGGELNRNRSTEVYRYQWITSNSRNHQDSRTTSGASTCTGWRWWANSSMRISPNGASSSRSSAPARARARVATVLMPDYRAGWRAQ